MVFVFFVQPGDMMTFDNDISIMQSVADLKDKIKEKLRIPQEQQVLLINGGEPLDAQKNLCSYMAGTDTNPIYLFSTSYEAVKLETLKHLNYDDSDIKQRLLDCVKLPVSLNTVKTRAQVAQELFNIAKIQLEFCENMVHEQHLQQQGWSAVIANLEDIVAEFRKRWELFTKGYSEFMSDRDTYDEYLNHFYENKKILQKIPVIESLLENQKEPLDTSNKSETTSTSQENKSCKEISLYEWISSSDTKSLDDLYELCRSNLKKFEKEIMPSLERQITDTLQSAEKQEGKEIEGLGKRLSDLEDLLRKIKKNVEHQSDMAQSFQQNQNRAAHIKDLSILPDLCATHVQQLDYIRVCHQKLMEDRTRIVRAKYELSRSLCARILWVQSVEDKLWELDSHLVYFHENLQRLRKHLEVFRQLHLAPVTYMTAVVEVVRRRLFSQLFLLWASDLACQQLTIHNEELTRRKEFTAQFEGHFLNGLFPGMSDLPPSFATEAPSMFDNKLPEITEDDIKKLKQELPEFSDLLTLPDMNHVVTFFMAKTSSAIERDIEKDKVDDSKIEDKLIQAVSEVGLASNLDKNLLKATGSEPCLVTAPGLPALKDDKGCESETDTEEFEKVGQSPLELNFPQGAAQTVGAGPKVPEKQDASTSTEDNLQISRSEHEKVKNILVDMGSLAKHAAITLRTELSDLKNQFLSESQILSKQYEDLGSSWENVVLEIDRNEKELVEYLKKEHETERENFRYNLLEKEDIIKRLEQDKRTMEDRIEETIREQINLQEKIKKLDEDSSRTIESLNKQLIEKELDKEKSLKELTDTIKLEHKAEIDNIKSRFKLMTMERSPSVSSLEKDKSGDFTSLPSHTTLLVQMTENFELDKERALQEERKRFEKVLQEKIKEVEDRFDEEKKLLVQEIGRRMNEDKDKQIDILRERERNLNLEIIKHKTTIQQLAESEADRRDSELLQQIDVLKQEREDLKKELEKVKSEKESLLTTSVAVCEGRVDAMTSPLQFSPALSDLSKSEISVSQRPHRLNIDTCKIGDIVLVLWDSAHENFKILQESKHLYFLHSDSLEKLGLTVAEGKPNKLHTTGEVIDKEYCHARKSENRYKVPRGTKFFRIKVKPIAPLPKDQVRRTSLMSTSQSTVTTFDPLMEESQSAALDLPLESKETETSEDTLTSKNEGQEVEAQNLTRQDDQEIGLARHESGRSDSECGRIDIIEQPEEIKPESVEKNFAEDSGIVENVEQATAAIEESDSKSEENDRCVACNKSTIEKTESSNWLEALFRSMFSKTD